MDTSEISRIFLHEGRPGGLMCGAADAEDTLWQLPKRYDLRPTHHVLDVVWPPVVVRRFFVGRWNRAVITISMP